MTWFAPSFDRIFAFSFEDVVAMTFAPLAFAICNAKLEKIEQTRHKHLPPY